MKNILFVFLIFFQSIFVYSLDDQVVNAFLSNYFSGDNFNCSIMKFGQENIYFSHNVLDNSGDNFNKAFIFMRTEDEALFPVFYINSNIIYNRQGEIIFKGVSETQSFFGWKINIIEKNSSFSLTFLTNGGNNVTEGPIFLWDPKNRTFKRYIIDRSQW
ncbi:MAG: hypothetical protein K9L66_08825 [Spirochaetaceae bacterium]|nr:hypothetical protein [Spirochaetaceae bacterium]MCF7951615.1 hypothetical protein [Spirochaetaceae bacterium]